MCYPKDMMREKLRCGRCDNTAVIQNSGGRRAFAIPGATPHYAPDRPLKLEHIFLDVVVDPKGKKLQGTATQRFRVISPNQKRLTLDQVGLSIEEVRIGTEVTRYTVEGQQLHIELPQGARAPKTDSTFEVVVKYSVTHPRRGLYFTGPDAHSSKKPYQVWSQGQDEDNRCWFPTFDFPNQKATFEIIAVVPKGFTAVSNGALLVKKDVAAGTSFHYKLGIPHVTYLISLAVGEFVEWSDRGPHDLPVQYFVAKGREEDGKRAFGNTPRMIEVFERKVGVPYPYEKYSQVAVQDFIPGGMENTSATTQTDLVLHDQRAHLDFSGDPLVSHELAHQWFGDLLTCRDWSHGWLNESFATFMERVWIENSELPAGGPDEAKYYSYMDLKEYLEEDSGQYRRPIVCNTYIEPMDLFDRHLYQKGGIVLNLIRKVLSEDLFWKSINLYVTRHRGQNVETIDLIRAIEDATGRNLRQFFDEWIFGAGHPEFELSYHWHDDKKVAELVIEQKQTAGQASVFKDGAVTHLFHLPAVIELTLEGGEKVTHEITLGEARDRVFLSVASKPAMVRFDPNSYIPKTLKFPRPKEMLLYQLAKDPDCMGRIEAAKELSKQVDASVIQALGQTVAKDSFWGVQAEVAAVLAEIRTDSARDALIAALGTQHPKARRAIVKALGTYKDARASEAVKKTAERDESYFVEAESTLSWASSKNRAAGVSPAETEQTEAFLLNQLSKDSYREVIRGAALRSLADLPGISRGERPKAIAALLDWLKIEKPMDARMAAMAGLAKIAKTAVPAERARILSALSELVDEDYYRTRATLVGALTETESSDAIPTLYRIREIDVHGRIKRSATLSIDALQTAGTTPESVANLKVAFEKLEEEHRKLRGKVEEIAGKA